jgi:hypothetical protein
LLKKFRESFYRISDDFFRAPITEACCTNVITMKAEHHSYKKLHRDLLTAAQSGLTKLLERTPFRQLPRKHGALGPSDELTRFSIRAFLFHGVEILKRDSSTHGHCARAKKQEIHRRVTSSVIATLFFNCYSSGTSVHLESVV